MAKLKKLLIFGVYGQKMTICSKERNLKSLRSGMPGRMKILNRLFCLLILPGIILLLTNCTKDDSEKPGKEELIVDLTESIDSDSLEADVKWLQAMGTRFALAENHKTVADAIKKRFLLMGYRNAASDSFLIRKTYRNVAYEQWQYNVYAFIRGVEYPDSLCIVGGHYDNAVIAGDPFAVVPGANDNASGTAAVLEIARVMKKMNFRPKSTIVFIAFGAEELGLWGSHDFAADPEGFSGKIRFMLNNDMIACEPDEDSASWYVNIIDYENSHSLRAEAEIICSRFTSLAFRNDNTYNKQSDSYPFFTNGYKALFFFSDVVDPNIHTLNDVAANCNFEYCREIVKLSCALLVDKN